MELVDKFIPVIMTQPECFYLLKLSKEDKVVKPMRDTPSPLPVSQKRQIKPVRDWQRENEKLLALMGVGWEWNKAG